MSDPDVQHARAALAASRDAGRAGHLPDRDGVSRRRRPAGLRIPREDRHLHQHRPPGPARPPGASTRRARRARTSGSSSRSRRGMGLDWNYAGPREVFDEMRQAMPSIAGITWERLEAESAVTYPCVAEGDPGERVVFTEDFPTESGLRPARARRHHSGGRAARCRISDGADHRPPARALAHRQHDAARAGARCDRTGAGGLDPSARPRGARRVAGRHGHGRIAPRPGRALRARRRRHAARRGVHPVLLLRSGREHADQSGARSVRQDPGVQVLRNPRFSGRENR